MKQTIMTNIDPLPSPSKPICLSQVSLNVCIQIPHISVPIMEQEIAEPLFHLKTAVEQLAGSQTFKQILATVLAIGNFLNGCKVSR